MAEISKITTIDGTTYDIKDKAARTAISQISSIEASFDGTALVFSEGGGGGSLPNAEGATF